MLSKRKQSGLELPRPMAVEVSVGERKLNDALRVAVRNVTKPEHCVKAESTRREIHRHRIFPSRHLMIVLRDAFERGAPEADVLAFAETLSAEISGWYKAERGELPWDTAHLGEEQAEGERENAELAYAYDRSPANAVRLWDAITRHEVATVPVKECILGTLASVGVMS